MAKVFCENNFCIYCNNHRCICSQLNLNTVGLCEDGICINLDNDTLQAKKTETIRLLERSISE